MNILTCWLRLAIRYQLQGQGSWLTMEEVQILENKWTCLQKLIDTFAHQSNVSLLNHKSTEEAPMSLLGDYLEYDHADDIDESGVPGHSGDGQSGRPPQGTTVQTSPPKLPASTAREKGDGGGKGKRRDVSGLLPTNSSDSCMANMFSVLLHSACIFRSS